MEDGRSRMEGRGLRRTLRGGGSPSSILYPPSSRWEHSLAAVNSAGRNRIITAPAPGMATAHSAQRQPASPQRPMHPQRVYGVLRTARRETAMRQRPEQHGFRGRNHPPVKADGKDQDMLNGVHRDTSILHLNNLAFLSAVKKSRSTAAKVLPAIEGRATRTSSTGRASSCWWSRNASRRSRRARLRTTAPPMRPDVTTPSRVAAWAGKGCPSSLTALPRMDQFATRQPQISRSPPWRTLRKSRPCLMRAPRGKSRRRGAWPAIGPPLFASVHVSTSAAMKSRRLAALPLYRGQPLAADAAAVAQNGTAALARTAVQEPMLPLAADL